MKVRLKQMLIVILLVAFIFVNFSSTCYAVAVTKENLSIAFQAFSDFNKSDSSSTEKNDYQFDVGDNTITVTSDETEYILNYDLTEKPIFSVEVPIQEGMSYDDYQEQIDALALPILGYMAVANIQNVEFEDAGAYILTSYFAKALKDSSLENSYIIIDDTKSDEGTTIEKDSSDSKIIYASEFGDKVMEFVTDSYKDKKTIADSGSDEINSYEFTTELKDITDTSCKIVASLAVNLDADFSKLIGYSDDVEDDLKNVANNIADKIIDTMNVTVDTTESNSEESSTSETESNVENNSNVASVNTSSSNESKLPQTGKEDSALVKYIRTIIILGIFWLCSMLLIDNEKKKMTKK